MRDQAQVQLYCRADPLLLWVRAIRIIQGAALHFWDVPQEQRRLHHFSRVILRASLPHGVWVFYTLSTVSHDQTADREIFFLSSSFLPLRSCSFISILFSTKTCGRSPIQAPIMPRFLSWIIDSINTRFYCTVAISINSWKTRDPGWTKHSCRATSKDIFWRAVEFSSMNDTSHSSDQTGRDTS